MRPALRAGVLSSSLALLALAGCDLPPQVQGFWTELQSEWNALLAVAIGKPSPLAQASPPAASPSPGEPEFSSPAARAAKQNAELLHEVFSVVFMREPRDRSEFGSLVDTLNQGASFEGVYNGFTHSSDYRKVEMANQGASPEALQIFGEELAAFELELPVMTEFNAASAQPLATAVNPGEDPANGPVKAENGVETLEFGGTPKKGSPKHVETRAPDEPGLNGSLESSPKPSPRPDEKTLADSYTKLFVGASIFTLKRVLGDEAQKVVADKKAYREKLATWYSQWVVHMASRNVDFGLPLRNKPDEQFHYQWAMSSPDDRLLWEVLNRVHRVLNEANKQKQGP
jgi:hypothetical protein